MNGILIDYHLVFIILSVILFIVTIIFLFDKPTKDTAIGSFFLIGFNNNLCWVNVFGFLAVNVYGFNDGVLVNNATADMFVAWPLFFGLGLVNTALLFYIPRLLLRFKELPKEKPIFKGEPPDHSIRP